MSHPRITVRIVMDTFTSTALKHCYPAATLTDNGMVYTTRYARNARGIAPGNPDDPNLWRVRYDTIDTDGKISLRLAGQLLHLGIGRAHARTEIIFLIHNLDATVIDNNGLVLAEFILNPNHNYQRKNG